MNLLNSIAYASKADIWRYCVLYTYGGLYLDDDATLGNYLDDVSLILFIPSKYNEF